MNLYGASVFLVAFGGMMLILDIGLLIATPFLLRRLGGLAPSQRPTAILAFRLAPVVLSFLVLTGTLLPAWWRFEPNDTGETASLGLLFAAFLAALPIVVGVGRAISMFARTRVRLQAWRDQMSQTSTKKGPFEFVEVRSEDLAFCVGGYLRPTIYASTQIMESLAPEEFSAALAHEISHASTRDPLRLLWMAACPDFLQLLGLDRAWRRAFATASEFAADARASHGDPEVALDLASALLKVARLKSFKPMSVELPADVAVSSAFSSRVEIEARVQALANPESSAPTLIVKPWMMASALLAFGAASLLASEQVHVLTERLGRLLAP
jgi:Zn-dependent protease with chaperone function